MTSTLTVSRAPDASFDGTVARQRQFVSTSAGLVVGGLAYFLTLLNFGTDLTRTTNASRIFSGFFDFQARAFLDGRIDIEPELLGIEGFVHDGQTYTYFPPFPALLRLPVLMTTGEFDYQLTLVSMAAAWIVLAQDEYTVQLGWADLGTLSYPSVVALVMAVVIEMLAWVRRRAGLSGRRTWSRKR